MAYDWRGASTSKAARSAALQNDCGLGLSGGPAEQDFLWKTYYQKDTFLSIAILGSYGRWAMVVPGWVWASSKPAPFRSERVRHPNAVS
jgi:hypothetical protein